MSHRFFRTDSDAAYEQVRLALDNAWGHQPPTTCIKPADLSYRDSLNRIVLAVRKEFTEYPAASAMLPTLINDGTVEEISKEIYRMAIPAD